MHPRNEATIAAIEYHLPEHRLTNDVIARDCPGRSADDILAKTGIVERRIAAPDESATDLACRAAQRLFDSGACRPDQVDYVLVSSATPEYIVPSTAAMLQARLGLPQRAGAIDVSCACAGFVYGLGLAKGLVETAQAERVLVVTAEVYSKILGRQDRNTRSVFGDAGAVTLVERRTAERAAPGEESGEESYDRPPALGPFVTGTDGRGIKDVRAPKGSLRHTWPAIDASSTGPASAADQSLYMNGPAVVDFVQSTVPDAVRSLCEAAQTRLAAIDLFVFHQASRFLLDQLRARLEIPQEKFLVDMSDCGNTASCSIPIALKRAEDKGMLHAGDRLALVGFGAGYTWAAALASWVGARPAGRHATTEAVQPEPLAHR